MTIGANLTVIAVGAILSFATHVRTTGFSLIAMGGVLMVVGAVGLFMQIAALQRQRELTAAQEEAPARRFLVRRPPRY